MFSDDVGQHTIPLPSVLRYRQTVDSIVEFIDNFPIRDEDGLTPGFYVAVSRDLADTGDWRGWALYADYGDGYVKISEGDIPAKIGEATTTLGTVSDPSVFDSVNTFTAVAATDVLTEVGNSLADGNSVRVSNSGGALPAPLAANTTYFVRDKSGDTFKLAATLGGAAIDITTDGTGTNSIRNVLAFTLKYGPPNPAPAPFSNATQAELIANPYRNLFIYGDEYLQAGTIVDNGDMTYVASDFYRGRFGTDAAELVHGATERIVYLDGSERFVPIDPSRAGIPYNYKAVTTNQDVADATAVSFTWGGGNFTAPTPTGIIVYRDADLNAQVSIPQRDDQVIKAKKYWVDVLEATGVTFTADATTNFLTSVAHGLVDGQEIAVANTGGALPAPLVKTTRYFVRDKTADTFKLALTVGGTAIDLTTAGTGTNKFSVIIRHMPVIPGMFNQAILEATTGSVETTGSGGWLKTITSTHTNDVGDVGSVVKGPTSGAGNIRQILGEITEPGASFEATWDSFDKTVPWDTVNNSAIFLRDDTPATTHSLKLSVDMAHPDYGGSSAPFVDLLTTAGFDGAFDSSGEFLGTRYRFQISGTEVRVYRNYAGPGSQPVFRGQAPVGYPATVRLTAGPLHYWGNVTIGGLTNAVTTYPASDQVIDLGSAPATLRFRVYEEREFAGVVFLGDITDFTT